MNDSEELSSAESRGKRLKRLRNLTNLSRKEIAERYHINVNTLKGWEVARHGGLTEKGAQKILRILEQEGVKCSLNWLLYEIGEGPQVFEKAAREPEEIETKDSIKDEEKNIIEELLLFRKHYKYAVDFIIKDNSMEPIFLKDDVVAGVRRYKKNIESLMGFNCIVQTAAGKTMLKNLRKGSKDGVYTLVSINLNTDINEPIIYDTELVFAAAVIWQRRKNPI